MTQDASARPNPFQPPSSEVAGMTPSDEQVLVTAGPGRRFGTFIADYACYYAISFCFGIVLAILDDGTGSGALSMLERHAFGFGFLVFFCYYAFFEGIWMRTPGKFIFGTRVVSEEGGKPTMSQVLGRTACRFIPFEALSCFGELGWHDKIPKTRVVLVKGR